MHPSKICTTAWSSDAIHWTPAFKADLNTTLGETYPSYSHTFELTNGKTFQAGRRERYAIFYRLSALRCVTSWTESALRVITGRNQSTKGQHPCAIEFESTINSGDRMHARYVLIARFLLARVRICTHAFRCRRTMLTGCRRTVQGTYIIYYLYLINILRINNKDVRLLCFCCNRVAHTIDRHQLAFDASGNPTHLLNGVGDIEGKADFTFTSLQPLNQK